MDPVAVKFLLLVSPACLFDFCYATELTDAFIDPGKVECYIGAGCVTLIDVVIWYFLQKKME